MASCSHTLLLATGFKPDMARYVLTIANQSESSTALTVVGIDKNATDDSTAALASTSRMSVLRLAVPA